MGFMSVTVTEQLAETAQYSAISCVNVSVALDDVDACVGLMESV